MECIENIKIVELRPIIFVIKLNVNEIKIQIKKQRLSNCIQNGLTICYLWDTDFKCKDTIG